MTVTATTNTKSYTGDGSATSFPTTFAFQGTGASAEIEVIERTIATGAEATKSYTSHYTVTGGNGSTGTVVAASAPADTVQWHIRRKTTQTQTTDYTTNDPFAADTHELALDRLAMVQQELEEKIGRKIGVSETTSITDGEIVDAASARASKILGFSADGNSLAVIDSIALPSSLTGAGLKMIRVNSGATAYEFQTPAQVFTNLLATESNGIIAHAGSGAAEPRTITGTSNEITLANGDGVSGNPTVSIPSAVTFTGKTITGGTYASIVATSTMAGDPSSAMHIATKQYVDGLLAGLAKRSSVRVATTANITIATALNNGDTLDGVTLANGNLVLVKDQSTANQNGIYVVGASPARDDLFDSYDEHCGALIHVEEGSANADKLFHCTSNTGGTLDSTSIVWANIVPGSGGTVTNIATAGMASGGAITSTGTVTVSITAQSALSAAPAAADQFAVYDASATAHKKITTTELFGSDQLTALAREYTKTQNFNMTTLTDASTISWDLSANQVATVTLGANRILGAPSNQVAGATYILIVVQDGTGSRTLDTSNAVFLWPGGTEPTLSTGAAAIDVLTFVSNGSKMLGVSQLGFA